MEAEVRILGWRLFNFRLSRIFMPIAVLCVAHVLPMLLTAQEHFPQTFVQYDSVVSCGNIHFTPIRFSGSATNETSGLQMISWKQALDQKKISVREVRADAGSDVALIEITNHSRNAVLISAGELIVGGKQDRLSAKTVIVPSGKEKFFLDVFCAEKGRWDRREKRFRYGGEAGVEIKKQLHLGKKQHDIWRTIDNLLAQKNIVSETAAYAMLLATENLSASDSACLRFIMQQIAKSPDDFAGFVISSGERIIACELFSSGELTMMRLPAIVKQYLPFTRQPAKEVAYNLSAVKDFMSPFYSSNKLRQQFIAQHGAAYNFNGHTFHIILYGD